MPEKSLRDPKSLVTSLNCSIVPFIAQPPGLLNIELISVRKLAIVHPEFPDGHEFNRPVKWPLP
jgi:hypothetical protein